MTRPHGVLSVPSGQSLTLQADSDRKHRIGRQTLLEQRHSAGCPLSSHCPDGAGACDGQEPRVCAHVRNEAHTGRSACAGRFLQTPSTAVSPSSSRCLRHPRMYRGRSQVSHPDTCPVTPPWGSLQGRAPVIRQCPKKAPGRPQAAEEARKTGMPLPTGKQ